MVGRIKLRMGIERLRSPQFATEPRFLADVKRQMKAVQDELESILEQVGDVTPDIALEALKPTFEKSQEYCPVQSGELKKSGYLEIVRKGDRPYVEIGYGKGGKPRYAPVVHEMPTYHEPPTRSKWLQAAIEEDESAIMDRIADGYRRFMSA
jgi:ribosome modulation factor